MVREILEAIAQDIAYTGFSPGGTDDNSPVIYLWEQLLESFAEFKDLNSPKSERILHYRRIC